MARPFVFGANRYAHHGSPIWDKPTAFLNGSFVSPAVPPMDVISPITGESIGHIPNCGPDITHEAIAAASKALPAWSREIPRERGEILRKFRDTILKYQSDIGHIMTRENGKPYAEAVGEVVYSSRYFEWFAGEAERVCGDVVTAQRNGVKNLIMKRPMGVVGIVTPWNFPMAMIARAFAGATAAGCTVVLKPSDLTPFSALVLGQVAQEVGLPDGVFNIITGDSAPIGNALCESFAVRKLSFTGSTRVGKLLTAQSAETMKHVHVELGGNAPLIVFKDANLDLAVAGIIAGKFRNAGQACVAVNRILVHEDVHDVFVEKLVKAVKTFKLQDGLQSPAPGTHPLGPVINEAAAVRIEQSVKTAVAQGAKVAVGGSRPPKDSPLARGHFYEATVLTDCKQEHEICQGEIFGPVAPVVKFSDKEDPVAIANNTKCGLASYVFTEDYKKQWNVPPALEFGMVGVNDAAVSTPVAPFGGVKESGYGRDGSKYGIEQFMDIQYVLVGNLS